VWGQNRVCLGVRGCPGRQWHHCPTITAAVDTTTVGSFQPQTGNTGFRITGQLCQVREVRSTEICLQEKHSAEQFGTIDASLQHLPSNKQLKVLCNFETAWVGQELHLCCTAQAGPGWLTACCTHQTTKQLSKSFDTVHTRGWYCAMTLQHLKQPRVQSHNMTGR
jgi:hypothetical protein